MIKYFNNNSLPLTQLRIIQHVKQNEKEVFMPISSRSYESEMRVRIRITVSDLPPVDISSVLLDSRKRGREYTEWGDMGHAT